jgi:hypothetical protein
MPELPVKEVRPSELHLPEIKRDEIVRALSEIRMPEIDLPKIDLPKIERPDVDLSARSFGRVATGIAVALGLVTRPRRSRWPLAVGGLIVAGLAAVAVLSNTAVRTRLSEASSAARDRVGAMRAGSDALDVGPDDAIAFDAAETAEIETSPFAEASTVDATGYPTGLGADHQNGGHVPEEAAARD